MSREGSDVVKAKTPKADDRTEEKRPTDLPQNLEEFDITPDTCLIEKVSDEREKSEERSKRPA